MAEGIRERGDKYQARVSWYVNGMKKEVVQTFDTLGKARAWRTDKLKEVRDTGEVFEPSTKLLSEFLWEWLATAKGNLRPSSAATYETMIRVHLVPVLGEVPLNRLTPAKVQNFYNFKRGDGTGTRTQTYLHATLHKALSFGVRLGYLRENPCDRTEKPRHQMEERRPLTQLELARFLEVAEGHSQGALFLLAATTGMRRGEVLGLRWSDLDLENSSLSICQQLTEVNGKKIFGDLKTKSSKRPIPLLPVVVEALKKHRKRQFEERSPEWKNQDLVFATANGGPLQPNNIAKRVFPALLKKAGIDPDRVSFHSLRHTAATNLMMSGASVKDVQGILGHARANMTLDRYAHIVEDSKRLAVERAAAMLAPITPKRKSQ